MADGKLHIRVPGTQPTHIHFDNALPVHVKEFVEGIPALLKAYYKWTDLPENYSYATRNLLDSLKYNKTTDEIFEYIRSVYLREFPLHSETDPRFLMQFAKDFYSQRGTENSLKFLFKVLYNEDVTVTYPSDNIFDTSNATWATPTTIRIINTEGLHRSRGLRIWGETSGASAILENFSIENIDNSSIATCEISGMFNTFEIGEIVRIDLGDISIYSRVLPSLQINIDHPGLGYREGAILKLDNLGDGVGLIAKISGVSNEGEILKVDVMSQGSIYSYDLPTFDMTDPSLFDNTHIVTDEAYVSIEHVPYIVAPGRYVKQKSFTSDVYYLYDGDYYQDFSYVIRSNVPLNRFKDTVKKLVHPVGTKMFAEALVDIILVGSSGFDILYHLSHPDDVNYKNPDHNSSNKFIDVKSIKRSRAFVPHMSGCNIGCSKINTLFVDKTLLEWVGGISFTAQTHFRKL